MYKRNYSTYNRGSTQYSRPYRRNTTWNKFGSYKKPYVKKQFVRRAPMYKSPTSVSSASGRPLTLSKDITVSLRYLLSRNLIFPTHYGGFAYAKTFDDNWV